MSYFYHFPRLQQLQQESWAGHEQPGREAQVPRVLRGRGGGQQGGEGGQEERGGGRGRGGGGGEQRGGGGEGEEEEEEGGHRCQWQPSAPRVQVLVQDSEIPFLISLLSDESEETQRLRTKPSLR